MEIAIKKNVSWLKCFLDHLFYSVYFRGNALVSVDILPVKIHSTHRAVSVVTNDNSVRVQHRHNFENERVSKSIGYLVIGFYKSVHEAFYNIRGIRLARVHAGCQNDGWSLSNCLLWGCEVRYYKHIAIVASESFAHSYFFNSVFEFWTRILSNKPLAIRVCVWIAISKEYIIIIILELYFEWKRIWNKLIFIVWALQVLNSCCLH